MLSSYEKAREIESQLSSIQDPILRKRAARRADQYWGLDVKAEKQRLRLAKPNYAFGRVLWTTAVTAIVLVSLLAVATHFMPKLDLRVLIPAAVLLLLGVGTITFFATGKLSSSQFTDITKTVLNSNVLRTVESTSSDQSNEHD